MKNEKPLVSPKTKGLCKNFDQSNSKPSQINRQYLCSFCWRELPDNSIRFNGIGACPVHFKLARYLIDGLRRNKREYNRRFREVNK
jgi:hypothetical protein